MHKEIKKENIQSLPQPWFGIDHGVDNYEEGLRLDEVQAFRISWKPEHETWVGKLRVVLKGGGQFETSLSEKGYDQFLIALKNLAKSSQNAE